MKTYKKLITTIIIILCFSITSYSQNRPKAVYKVGNSKVVVWENEKEGKYGKFKVKNFQVVKEYKKDGKWKKTSSFNLKELIQLRKAIDKAIIEESVEVEK